MNYAIWDRRQKDDLPGKVLINIRLECSEERE